MSTSSNNSQSTYSPSEPETPQGTAKSRIQALDQSLNNVDVGISAEPSVKEKEMHQKRIQALRQELEYLKFTSWAYEYEKELENDDQTKESFLADQLLDIECLKEEYLDESSPTIPEIPRNAACFQRTGLITYIEGDNYLLIDGMLYFDLSSSSISFKVNDKVLYLGYKDENDSIIVVRILENYGLHWGDSMDVEENQFKVIEHVIIGEVDYRQERLVYMKDNDLKFSLDEVEATFIPMKGDWLELSCSVQWQEDKPADISAAQVIKVISFKPLRSKVKSAVVTSWSGDSGTCDRQFFFNRQSVQNGNIPQVGAKVMAEAIESNQGACAWRVIKLIVVDGNPIKQNNDENKKPEGSVTLDLEKERNLLVTYPVIFENVNFQKTENIMLNITNNSEQTYVINKWIMLSKKRDSQVSIKPFINRPLKIYPGHSFSFTITCCPKFMGHSKECFIIMFHGFQVKRFIEINVVNENAVQLTNNSNIKYLGMKSEVEKIDIMKDVRKNREKQFVPGVKPVRPPNFIPVRVGAFPIPDKIWAAVLGDSEQTIYSKEYDKIIDRLEVALPCLCQELNIGNYLDRWHTLLYIEEIQANISMRAYDTPKVFLIHCQEFLGIEFKGLGERRPSLIKGDRVIVKDTWGCDSQQFEGYIHVIRGDLVLIKFCPQFHETYSGSDVSVEFHFNRSVYRKAHQAVNLAISNLGPDILFPMRIVSRQPQISCDEISNIKWCNESLNPGQKAAVTNIILGECRPMPYCIYGPPGTGKTITVIETILQIISLLPDSRILVATPSNSAADLITERLIDYKSKFSGSVIRLIANHLIDSDNIPDAIKPFCATLDIAKEDTSRSKYQTRSDGINLNCQTSFVGRHRVTIGTCFCLGTLVQMGLPRGHFTHVIVDEAGQATEPEIMIPLTFLDKETGQIILAGDPQQLGPVVLSKYCTEFSMDESYLSRILETFPYQRDFESYKDGFNKKLVTKLNYNYRSLKEVLTLPSQMFYDGSLIPKMDRNETWVSKTISICSEVFDSSERDTGGIFVCGIKGVNARAEDSPSWFNLEEASMVALTTCKLYKKNINLEDIGIITPYIAQVKYLRVLFESMGLPQPKIGTVEEFQGQERPIILISTVRSAESYLQDDKRHTLGFVQNPKRLNVALTRAQVAVFLFCNPHLLSKDPLWSKVIAQAVKEDKYKGCDLPHVFETDNKNVTN